MPKKKTAVNDKTESSATQGEGQSLGKYLAAIRGIRQMTLREVEEATEREVSNAYLSQLENDKITRPSPNILHAISVVYAIPYDTLMEKAGYFSSSNSGHDKLRATGAVRHGRAATFTEANLTEDEEESLLQYLAFLRSQRGKGGKT